MDIILTEDIAGLGDLGEQVKVKPGYAKNYLIPRGFAIAMGTRNAKALMHAIKQLDAKKKQQKGEALLKANSLEQLVIELTLKVGEFGKVFGAIHARDIATTLEKLGHNVDRRRVVLPEPIKKIGEHKVKVKLHSEVFADVKVNVLALSAQESDITKAAENLKNKLETNKSRKKKGEKDA